MDVAQTLVHASRVHHGELRGADCPRFSQSICYDDGVDPLGTVQTLTAIGLLPGPMASF
jgi:hypothetical protein